MQRSQAEQGNFDGKSGDLTVPQAFADALSRTTGNSVLGQYFFFVSGKSVGSFGQLTDPNGNFTANFDVNFTPVSPTYPPSVPATVVAQSGDTLLTIAARVFGDSSLWYLIAQENGLTDPNATIAEGTELRIPNNVVSLHNSAQSFKPFDVSKALGNTTPVQPFPPPPQHGGGGCGGFGEILVAIVAIVVTYYTAGAASEAFASAFGTSVGAGTASSVAASTLGAAVGGAAGSVASQGVGIAIGEQSSFSFSQVASAAIGGAFAGGLLAAEGAAANSTEAAIANAALDSAASQGANIALGLQKGFSWAAVAASALAAPLAKAAGERITGTNPAAPPTEAERIAGNLTQGAIDETAYAAFTGGKINYAQIVADGFGNPIADSLQKLFEPENDLQEIQVSAQRIDSSTLTAAGSTSSLQDAPLTSNLDESSFYQPNLDQIASEVPLPPIAITAQPGDSVSSLVGTSDPVAIEAFMRANGMSGTDSTIYAGQPYNLPGATDYAAAEADGGRQGQATLDASNTMLLSKLQSVVVTAQMESLATDAVLPPSSILSSGYGDIAFGAMSSQNPLAGAFTTQTAAPLISQSQLAISTSGTAHAEAINPATTSAAAGIIVSGVVGAGDLIGGGLWLYSSSTQALLDSQGVESAAFKVGGLTVKYGLPAVITDLPAGVGAAIGVGQAYSAYREGNYVEAGEKLASSGGSIVGGAAGEIATASLIAEGSLVAEGTAAAVAATVGLPVVGALLLGAGAVIAYRYFTGYRPHQ